jgi:hypothetical protein
VEILIAPDAIRSNTNANSATRTLINHWLWVKATPAQTANGSMIGRNLNPMTCRLTKYPTETIAQSILNQISHRLEELGTTTFIQYCSQCQNYHIRLGVTQSLELGNDDPPPVK